MARKITRRDTALLDQEMVPANVAASWGEYALSTMHRAVTAGRLRGQRVNHRLYIHWPSFLGYVGPLATKLPKSAKVALETAA